MKNEQYLGIKDVARILGVTPLTLRNWDKRGVLAAYRNPINNYRVYRYADVADFVAEINRTKSRPGQSHRIPVKMVEEVDEETTV